MTMQREAPEAPGHDGARRAGADAARSGSATAVAGPSRPAWPTGPGAVAWFRRWSVALACLVTAALHLMYLTGVRTPDEGGFAMVARHWNDPGAYLYGPQWVDRPPLLIAFFAAADRLGPYGTRIVATFAAVVLVAAIALAARIAGGPRAGRWAAWTAAAFASSAYLSAEVLNGEILAAPLVALAVAATVAALRRHPAWIVPAGVLAGSAVFVKQNFVDALAFAGVLVLLTAVRERALRRGLVLLGGFLVGVAVPVVVAVLWSRGRGGPDALFYAMYGFRLDAAHVMADWSTAAPQRRLQQLLLLALASGQVSLLLLLALGHVRRLRRLSPMAWAIAAAGTVELVGVLGGANFWAHYLIGLIPMVALATGLAARRAQPARRWIRGVAVFAAVATLVTDPVWAVVEHQRNPTSSTVSVGNWLRSSAEPHDTLAIPFTHADVLDLSRLTPVYPYSWSLPLRTRDPHLTLLVSTLEGPTAPDWVVRWDPPHLWGLDPHDLVERALQRHYDEVAVVCGHQVWLHKGLHRDPAPPPAKGHCHARI
jgi:hypothetical protein